MVQKKSLTLFFHELSEIGIRGTLDEENRKRESPKKVK